MKEPNIQSNNQNFLQTPVTFLKKILNLNPFDNWVKEYTISWNYRCGQNLYFLTNGCNSQIDISGLYNNRNLEEKRIVIKAGSRNFYTAMHVARRRVAALKVEYGNSRGEFHSYYLAFEKSKSWKHFVTLPSVGTFGQILATWESFLKPFQGLNLV